MPVNAVTVRLSVKMGLLMAWLRVCRVAAYVIGPDRAMDWARAGADHLVLYRFGKHGRWRVLRSSKEAR